MSESEKKGSAWPWILVPIAAISLFFVLRACRQSIPPAEHASDRADAPAAAEPAASDNPAPASPAADASTPAADSSAAAPAAAPAPQ